MKASGQPKLRHARSYSSGPRTEAFKSKTRAFNRAQRDALLHWLKTDKVTYAVARERLKKEFGISLSISAISRFWHRHCAPPLVVPDVLLDIVIKSAAPVRLMIKRKGSGVHLTQLKGEPSTHGK